MGEGGVLKLANLCIFPRQTSVRYAHLQRHLSAKYIEQRRYFDKYQYHSQSTTKLPKLISLAFQLFLQRAVKMGTNAITALCRFCVKVRPCSKSEHQKNF